MAYAIKIQTFKIFLLIKKSQFAVVLSKVYTSILKYDPITKYYSEVKVYYVS